jgi:hypothetical protein
MLPGIFDFLVLKLAIDSFTVSLSLCTQRVSLSLAGDIVEDRPGEELTVMEASLGEAEERDRPGMELTVLEAADDTIPAYMHQTRFHIVYLGCVHFV